MAAHRQVLKMHGKQREVFNDPRRYKCVVAGRRWGKTQLSKLAILKRAVRPKQLIWYVAPTYQMARGIMWEELKNAIPRKWIAANGVNETRMSIRLINGTRIELKGADKPDTLRGVGLHLIIVDEAQDIKPDTWYKVLRPTLASTRGSAIIIGTPKSFNWLYDIYTLGQQGDTILVKRGRHAGRRVLNPWKSWQFPTITSPFIPLEEIEAARADMDEKSFRQEFEASFETMSGRVYYTFDRKVHVGDYPFNPRLPIWLGQDFNVDPMSTVVMQPQSNGEVWIVDEIILRGSNTQETVDEAAKRYFRHVARSTWYPDPAGATRSTKGRGESDLDIIRDAWNGAKTRIKYRRKHPKIADRVNAVNRMFRAADGSIKMRVNSSCKHTIAAFEQTIYKPNSREIDKSAGLEHPADAAGYCIEIEFPWRSNEAFGISI